MIRFDANATAEERLEAIAREATREVLSPAIVALAGACGRHARRRAKAGVYSLDLAYLDACIEAVQGVTYVPDAPGTDVYRSPVETLIEGGDCEDLSGLLWALVRCGREFLGRSVWASLVWVVQLGAPQDHVTVWASTAYLPAWRVITRGETPTAGAVWSEVSLRARRGESPYEALRRLGVGHGRIVGTSDGRSTRAQG